MLPILTLLASLCIVAPKPSPDVILITIDGSRWQEIYNGTDASFWHWRHYTPEQIVPNLYAYFVGQGIAIGRDSPIIASGPNHISLPGYLELTRGHPSIDCQSNYCNPYIDQSIFWFFQHPAVFASWNTIKETIPETSNACYDVAIPWERLDNATELAAIAYLDRNSPDFLWVALGDTDEFAHRNDYPRYIEALQMADAFVGYLVNRFPTSTFVITADHGRNQDFKDHGSDKSSERVWLMMRGPNVPVQGIITTKPLTLSSIFPTITDIEFSTHSKQSILEQP